MPRRYEINPEEWEAIASDLGFGINYWCRELSEAEREMLKALRLPEMYTVAVMAIDPDSGEDDQLLLMSKRDYEWALGQIEFLMPGTYVSGYVASAFADRDPKTNFVEASYFDSEVADAVAQLHLFGEIQYG